MDYNQTNQNMHSVPPKTNFFAKNRLIFIFFGITLLISLIFFIIARFFIKPQITITTSPKEANIFINDQFIGISPITTKVKLGSLTIRATRENFFTEELSTEITRPQTISLTLSPIPQLSTTQTISTTNLTRITHYQDQQLIAIDASSNKLVVLDLQTNQVQPLTSQPEATINKFSFSSSTNKMVVETEAYPSTKPHQYFLINLNTSSLAPINLSTYDRLSSFSLSPDGTTLAFFGNYDKYTNTSKLFFLDLNSFIVTPITNSQISATGLLWNTNRFLVLTQTKDAFNANTAQILDLNTQKITPLVESPNYYHSLTPHPQTPLLAYFSQDGLAITNLETNDTQILLPNSSRDPRVIWLDANNLLFFTERFTPTTSLTKVNINTKSISPPTTLNLPQNHQFISFLRVNTNLYVFTYNHLSKQYQLIPPKL